MSETAHIEQQQLLSVALSHLRGGTSPNDVLRRLISDGATAQQVAAALRTAHDTLSAERHSAEEMYRRIAQRIAQGASDEAILREALARGVDHATAQQLIVDAREAWRRMRSASQWRQPSQIEFAVFWLVALIVLIALANSGRALWMARATIQAAAPNAIVLAEHINLRSGPGAEYPILLELPENTTLTIIGRSNGRFKVRVSENVEGWIRSDPQLVQVQIPLDTIPVAR